mgnify:CR=1 FL=1
MAYTSCVSVAIKESDYNKIKSDGHYDELLLNASLDVVYDEDDGKICILRWNSVKWYTTRDDIVSVGDIFMHKLRSLGEYEYLRLGQDVDDIEHEMKFFGRAYFSLLIKSEL